MNGKYKIKGWVARDQITGGDKTNLYFGYEKPTRIKTGLYNTWFGFGDFISLPKEMFPELTWKDEPIEVEFTIKKV